MDVERLVDLLIVWCLHVYVIVVVFERVCWDGVGVVFAVQVYCDGVGACVAKLDFYCVVDVACQL